MTDRRRADRLVRLYPRQWRERYGVELQDLVDELTANGELSSARVIAGLVVSALVQRVRTLRPSWRTLAVTGSALVFVLAAITVVGRSDAQRPARPVAIATKGTIPQSTGDGMNFKRIPDFISALGRDGEVVGYIPKAYLFPEPNQAADSKLGSIAPVYGRNLKTLVGHMYPGVGFVALGESPAAQPCMPIMTHETTADGRTTSATVACPSTAEAIPDVVGLSLPTAMGQLSATSLQGSIRYVHSRSVAAGLVINVSPGAGTRVPARSFVSIVSSLGAGRSASRTVSSSTVTVPGVVGSPTRAALTVLKKEDLPANVSSVHSDSVPAGHVVSVAPAPGARVTAGQLVSVVGSLGRS